MEVTPEHAGFPGARTIARLVRRVRRQQKLTTETVLLITSLTLAAAWRIFSIHESPCGWPLCKSQVGESLRAGGVVLKTLLESAHGAAPFDRATLVDPMLGQADGQSAEGGQDHRRVGLAHAAAVLIQADVQRLMPPAFNDPIEPFVL